MNLNTTVPPPLPSSWASLFSWILYLLSPVLSSTFVNGQTAAHVHDGGGHSWTQHASAKLLPSKARSALEREKLGSAPPAKLLTALMNSLGSWNQAKLSQLPWEKLSECDANF